MGTMDDKGLKIDEACKLCGNLSRGAFYNAISRGDLPRPKKIGNRSIWLKSELLNALRGENAA